MAVATRCPDAREEELVGTLATMHGVRLEHVLLGCGSIDILRMADAAFLDPGRTVVAAEPTFEAVLAYNRTTKANVVKVPLDAAFRHDLPRMAAACDSNTGLVYVCNPNNPTGTIVPGKDVAAFLERVPPSVQVLLDEAYCHFVEDPGYSTGIELLATHPNLIVVRTFSKIYGLAGRDAGPLVKEFQTWKILVGRKFPSMPTWLQVTVGTPAEMTAFVAALRELVPIRTAA